jgi:hypothetical protein
MAKRILILGDSHSRPFELIDGYDIDIVYGFGGSAAGLNNPNSVSQVNKTFTEHLSKNKEYDATIIQIGEVDCSITIWKYSNVIDGTVKSRLRVSLEQLEIFIKQNIKTNKIAICAPTLPSVKDNMIHVQDFERRTVIKSSQKDKTWAVNIFEMMLEDMCEMNGWHLLTINNKTINSDTDLVDDYWIKDPADWHLDKYKVAPLWLEELKGFIHE